MSASGIEVPASLPPPPVGSTSAGHDRFRKEAHCALQQLLAYSAASGTARNYEATLRAIAPKVSAKLSLRVLPMGSRGAFYAVLAAVWLLGPKSPSSVTGQPAVRWSYVKLVKAAAAFWHVLRGKRAIFEDEWSPRMGVFWNGIKRSRVRATSEKSPLLLEVMRAVRIRGESASAHLRQAVARKDLPAIGCGLGSTLEDTLTLRAASSMSTAFFGVRRASEVAALDLSEVCVDPSTGLADIKARRQKTKISSAWGDSPISRQFPCGVAPAQCNCCRDGYA